MKLCLHLHSKLGMVAIMTLAAGWAINAMAEPIAAIGGDIVFDRMDGATAYRFHVFTNAVTTNLSFSTGGEVDVLIVGGGGGGGGDLTSSGGGGGVVFTNLTIADDTSVTVTVGEGGVGSATQNLGQPGVNSVFGAKTAYGGGGRGANNGDGASGSGSSGRGPNEGAAVDYTPYQGHDGGVRTGNYGGGGGGGAGGVGGGVGTAATVGGVGGVGLDYSHIVGTIYGEDGWFGGGGGGCSHTFGTASVGAGGKGGGGTGGTRDVAAEHGLPNSGGGGGGGGNGSPTHIGGDGGSGIVIVRYELESAPYLISQESMILANPINANTEFTRTNEVNVVGFPIPEDYTHYQITESGDPAAIDSGSWIATNVAPTKTFALPAADTNIILYAWFTNATTESVWIWRAEGGIAYATDLPDVSVHAALSRGLPPGPTMVVLTFDDIDDGTTGGEYDGTEMLFNYGLSCGDDVTSAEPYVTLDSAGDYDVVLTVTNAAGSVGVATSVVSVTARTEYRLYVSPNGDNSTGIDWQSAYQHPSNALVYAVSGDTILLSGDTFVLNAQLDLDIENLTLSGSYAATNEVGVPGEQDIRRWRTVLTRDPAVEIRMIQVSANDVTVEGIEMREGYLNPGGGAGLYAADVSNLTIQDCRFLDGYSYLTWGRGGGAYLLNAVNARIERSLFRGNTVGGYYGTPFGAALSIEGGSVSLFDVIVTANASSGTAPGIYASGGTHAFTNILVINNSTLNRPSDSGGGLRVMAGTQVTVANSTFSGNYPNAIRNQAGANTVIRNSILHGNFSLAGGVDLTNTAAEATMYNNIIGDGSGTGSNENLDDDPLFDGPLFYLASDSPALNSGDRTVAEAGLSGWTSLTDGTPDSGTVNRGYHYAEGLGIDLELYVSPDGNDANDGSGPGPGDAVRTLTRAFEITGQSGWLDPRVRIHIAPGEYTDEDGEVFPLEVLEWTVQLIGTDAENTIIDAGGSAAGNRRVFKLVNSLGDNRIEGVTIKGGHSVGGVDDRFGVGVHAANSILMIDSAVLRDNVQSTGGLGTGGEGGGLYALDSSLVVRNTVIRDNQTAGGIGVSGGGVRVQRGRMMLVNMELIDNRAYNNSPYGGARGGGLYTFGSVVLRNVLMVGNNASLKERLGNAIFLEAGQLLIENVTIATNINDNSSGVAIHRNNGSGTLRNTILWDNVGDFSSTNSFNIAYSLSTELDDGVNNNLIADPLFVDADAGDFRLTALSAGVSPSPAIDVGTNLWWMADAVDLAGLPRILRGIPSNSRSTVDMGAYEAKPPPGSVLLFR